MAFKLESITYEFSRVSTSEALEIRKIVMNGLAKIAKQAKADGVDMTDESAFDLGQMNDLLCDIEPYALKHLRILNADGKTWTENPDTSLLESFFENPFYAMAISSEFLKVVQGFLALLPSFQNMTTAKK